MTDWDSRFLDLARHIASWSKDPSTKVGAVIVDDHRRILSLGYNGFPRGVEDRPERYADRKEKYPRIVHAEMNAILNSGVPWGLRGTTLYASMLPCVECAKAIIQAGIRRVVVPQYEENDRWNDSQLLGCEMFDEAEVEISLS